MLKEPNQHLVLAEDNPDEATIFNRAFAGMSLSQSLAIVANGDLSIKYLKGEGGYSDRDKFPPPTCVILDLNLPAFSWLEVLSWIRASDEFRDLPVIVLSSLIDADYVQATHQYGITAFLAKPPQSNRLRDAIVMALKQVEGQENGQLLFQDSFETFADSQATNR
jgi:CheY-like chemotaxis protein